MGKKKTVNADGTPAVSTKSSKKFSTNIGQTLTGTVDSVSFADGEAIVMEFQPADSSKLVTFGCESDEKTIDRLFTILAKHNHTGKVIEVGVVGDQIAWVSR